jgi:hypothetical protein
MTAMPPREIALHFCSAQSISAEERRQWIATAAYFIAQRRGFAPGCEADDWREAEVEIECRIANGL